MFPIALTFTITNAGLAPVTDLAFTDVLPTPHLGHFSGPARLTA